MVEGELTKDLLVELYVNQGLSINKIAKRINRSYNYVKKKVESHSLSQVKDHLDKEWLYHHYIVKNMSTIEVAELAGVTNPTVASALRRFGIKKDKCAKQEARLQKTIVTNLEKYGVEHSFQSEAIKKKIIKSIEERYGVKNPMQNKEIKKRAQKTNIKKFGAKSPAQSPEVLDKIIATKAERGLISLLEDGRTINRACLDADIPPANAYRLVRDGAIMRKEIRDYIEQYNGRGNHLEKFFSDKLNLDIYNKVFDQKLYPQLNYKPDFKLSDSIAINVDGLYWHSDANGVDKNYHFNLRKDFEDLGLKIFQFREDEVYGKIEIIKSMLNNALGMSQVIYARKTKLQKISPEESRAFFSKNHLMGAYNAPTYALILNDEIVMAVSYKVYSDKLKIERLCSKAGVTVVGGASKIFARIRSEAPKLPIHYWADLRYGTGNYLKKLGFHKERETLGFKWTDKKRTYNRLGCRANMDKRGLSQAEQADEWGWSKIYDAGQRLWTFN